MKPKKVFLGGTCNNSTWRKELIEKINIDYYNPVVPDWTPECQAEEIRQRETCDLVLYAITAQMTGVYSIAEVIDDSNKRPEKTVFCVLGDGFDDRQLRSLEAVKKMVAENGGSVFGSLEDTASYLNNFS